MRAVGGRAASVRPVSVSAPTATLPPVRDDQAKLAQLAITKRRATGLLLAASVVFLLTLLGDGERGWLGFVRAIAEASMVPDDATE